VIAIAEEVATALAGGAAVVALESTLIAHGLPYPDNLAVASALEAEVRGAGAVPATIAVVDGQARVGLGAAELERIASGGHAVMKCRASDLPVALATRRDAATTVSATALLAARAGIRLFATGGIGGVHRGDTGDVSQDLHALAALPIAVVSAGAKAVLDLPRTLEALESLGVLVLGYRVSELPAFYTTASGLALDHRLDDVAAIAAVLHRRFVDLGQGGVLVANAIPDEAALDPKLVVRSIEDALAEAGQRGARGRELTPFLLARVASATGGASVAANRALAVANARVAAEIAVAYTGLAPAGRSE
jgi:pseudouridine-5'-phosphate glycosidase